MKSLSVISEGVMYELPYATGYADAADNLLGTMDLSVQKDSYRQFVEEIIPYYLYGKGYSSKYNTTKTTDMPSGLNIVIEFDSWFIKNSPYSAEWCKKHHASMEAELYANARVQVRNLTERGESVAPHERYLKVLVTKFPMLTKSGSMIINGVEKILTSHLEPACKVRLETLEKKGSKGEKVLKFITAERVFNNTKAGVASASNSQVVIQRGKTFGSNYPTYTITIGQYINNYQLVDFLRAISADTLKESFLREVLGVSQQLLSTLDATSFNLAKHKSEAEVLENFEVRFTERRNLNKRLSYEKRATGRVLAKDIPEMGLEKGHVLTKADAIEAQFRGIPLYVLPKTGLGLNMRIFSNNFVSADVLFDYYKEQGKNIVKTDMFKGKMIHRPTFINLYEKSQAENTDINTLLKLNYAELIGRNLLVDDVIALVNLYGAFLADDETEDDIDSLAVKSITNISEIYEEIFSSKFRLGGDGYLPEKFVTALNRAKSRGNSDSESHYAISSIDIDCEDRQTITAKLGTCSLLDQADTAGPLSEVNHLRKVSLKKVEGRGGTDSETSMRKPRSVNPSMINRFDLVESPEGANIGLIRYLTVTAMVNSGGDVEAPWLLVDPESKRIIYDRVVYLDYDTEMDLTRAIGSDIGTRDAVKIKIYGLNPKYRDMKFGKGPVNIDELPWDDDAKWVVIEEQEYPVAYSTGPRQELQQTNENYITCKYSRSKIDMSELKCDYAGSYELADGTDYQQIAETLMKRVGGFKYELDFQRENWFKRQHVVDYKYNVRTKRYEPTTYSEAINCYQGHGKVVAVPAEEVDVVSLSDEHIFSPVGSSVPFTAYDDLTRKMMSNAHQKSAEPVLYGMKPSITTSIAKKSTDMATGVVKSPVSGVVKFVDSSKVTILEDGTNMLVAVPLVTGFKSVTKTMIISVPSVRLGDKVRKGELLADSNMTQDGDVAHGIEVLGAYMPFDGINFEDGILLSDRLVAYASLTSPHFKTCVQKLTGRKSHSRKSGTEIFSPIQTYKATQERIDQMQKGRDAKSSKIVRDRHRFNDDFLIKPGTVVSTNDVLAYYITETVSSDSDMQESNRTSGMNTKVRLNSLVYRESETGFIISSDIITIRGEDYIQIIVGHEEHIKQGDKLSGRHGNKGVIAKILPYRDMPRTEDGRIVDFVWSPLGVPSRMNIGQLNEGQLNLFLHQYGLEATTSATSRFDMKQFSNLMCEFNQRKNGSVTIMDEHGQVRHKGSMEFGKMSVERTRLEAGIYCIYPYHDDMDMYSLKVNGEEVLDFKEFISQATDYRLRQPAYINEYISVKCYGDRELNITYDERLLLPGCEYALKFLKGGNDEDYCVELFLDEDADIELSVSVPKCTSDKVQLHDGRTGLPFELKTNLVRPFIIKHKHQVSEKKAARSAGTFYNNNDQPPQGKEREGGQKLGAMEIWGLAESGAVKTLNEFMTYKSDDKHGRQRFAAYINTLRLKNNIESGLQQQHGSITDLELESALGPTSTNAPFITKKITAMLAASFHLLKFYNADGEELYIFEDAVKGMSGDNTNVDVVGVRNKDSFILGSRGKVSDAHSDIIQGRRDSAYLSSMVSYKSSDSEFYNGLTLPGVSGYSVEYSVLGSRYAEARGIGEDGAEVSGAPAEPVVAPVNLGDYSLDDMEFDGIELDGGEFEEEAVEESIFNAGTRVINQEPINTVAPLFGGRLEADAESSLEGNQIITADLVQQTVEHGLANGFEELSDEENDIDEETVDEEE